MGLPISGLSPKKTNIAFRQRAECYYQSVQKRLEILLGCLHLPPNKDPLFPVYLLLKTKVKAR